MRIPGCRARRVVLAAALAARLAAGCAVHHPMAYRTALASGDRAYSAGRMPEAAAAFDLAARSTPLARDRDEALYLAAGAWWRAGDLPAALSRYDQLASAQPAGERAPRAALEASRIRRAGTDAVRADADLLVLVRRFPDTGPGRRALDLALEDLDAADPTLHRSLALLDDLAHTLAAARLLDAVLMERARRLERMGDIPAAVAAYQRLLDTVPYPGNRHWDDGGLALVRALRTAGDPQGAVAVANRVLAVREPSWGNGDYEAPHFGDLALLRGTILRDDLHALPEAAAAYHFLYGSFRSSRLRDDALWQEAATWTLAGNQAAACGVYVTLAREFPCTRPGRESVARAAACGETVPTHPPHACR